MKAETQQKRVKEREGSFSTEMLAFVCHEVEDENGIAHISKNSQIKVTKKFITTKISMFYCGGMPQSGR